MQTRIIACSLLAGLCLSAVTLAQEKPQDKLLTPQCFERQVTFKLNYLLFLPRDYHANAKKTWPLILFLHGAGERGTNLWLADVHGPSKYLAEHPDFPFILVSPQCAADQVWSNEALLALLDEVMARHQVDRQRVYLTGLSMGGYGTWSLALAHPEKFAAVAPICGGGTVIEALLVQHGFATPAKKAALKSLPLWAFHGGKDTVVPPDESKRMVQALKQAGAGEVKLTIYPEATHNAWAQTYSNPEFYEWLLAHQRP